MFNNPQKYPGKLPAAPLFEEPALPCSDKLAFDTQREANAVIHTLVYKYGTPMRSYRCQHCALWHLSSSVQQV